ncbi:MAG: integrase/recombinase XerD, partial [Pseudohongiellaceae bacterium]
MFAAPFYVASIKPVVKTTTLGIRLSEALFLQVGDIDGKTKRVHIHEGKGCKDRFVILPDN